MKKLGLLLCLALLAACSSEPPPQVVKPVIELTPRYNLDVLMVSVVDHSPSPATDSPYNTNDFKPTLAAAINQALTQRLIAVGTTGQALVTITDASLKSEPIPHKEDDWFERPQASKYIAHAAVSMQIDGREGQGQVNAEASRYVTLPLNPTTLERQNAYYTVMNGLLHDLGVDLSRAIESHINRFIVTAPLMGTGSN